MKYNKRNESIYNYYSGKLGVERAQLLEKEKESVAFELAKKNAAYDARE